MAVIVSPYMSAQQHDRVAKWVEVMEGAAATFQARNCATYDFRCA